MMKYMGKAFNDDIYNVFEAYFRAVFESNDQFKAEKCYCMFIFFNAYLLHSQAQLYV